MMFLGSPLINVNTTLLKWHGELQSPTITNIGKPCLQQKNVSDLWREALNHFDTTMSKNNILYCEKLIKADWLTMMGNSDIRDIPPIIIQSYSK
jgi:hypothetical protein